MGLGDKLVVHDGFPEKRSFVAVWIVNYKDTPTLFTASLHYNAEEDQYYSYDNSLDIFLPECDHGYDKEFLNRSPRLTQWGVIALKSSACLGLSTK